MPTTNILDLLNIPNLEAVTIRSGIALKAAPKHRLSVSDFASKCGIDISQANILIDALSNANVLERYVFQGENWVRTTIKTNRNKN
jgi:ribosomal protein S25